MIRWLCREQERAGRYYLIEGPVGAEAWRLKGIFHRTAAESNGKFVWGDRCRYGSTAGLGRTGWFSNAEILLNRLAKRCYCARGAHGKEKEDDLRQQALPRKLCKEVCQGVLDTMKLDYAVAMSYQEGAFWIGAAYPVDMEVEEDEGDEDFEEPWEDEWRLEPDGRMIRVHRAQRRKLFVPYSSTAPPCRFQDILGRRRTRMLLADGTRREHEDDWHQASWDPNGVVMDFTWTGETEFQLAGRWGGTADPGESSAQRPQPPPDQGGYQEESAMPFDSAAYEPSLDYEPSFPDPEAQQVPLPPGYEEQAIAAVPADAGESAQRRQPPPDQRVLRRRQRTRQLQRGFWSETSHEETVQLLEGTLDYIQQEGTEGWNKINLDSDLGKAWASLEGANAEVILILGSTSARRLKKPQPHAGPHEVPLRKSFVLLGGGAALTTDWEQWYTMSPSAQIRPITAKDRKLYVALFGKEIGEAGELEQDKEQQKELVRERQWQALPRELKLAIKRVHENLGHASQPAMLRALRIARASETAIKACRLFRCRECPRLAEPKHPRPSKLPVASEFNVMVGIDVLTEKDSAGQSWSWLNILCQGTSFQVCMLLGDTHSNPTGAAVLEALGNGWLAWAGYPERGVVTDRGKYFLSTVAEDLAGHGCHVEPAARAAPWQLGQIERHGGIWKSTFRKAPWAQQVAGLSEVRLLTAAVNQSKNSLTRKGGFSPSQWVLGRDLRLPADLADDAEVERIGAQALAATPGTTFFRKAQLRQSAREAFARAANDEALRRAELRQVRPSRGPFPIGTYVFYYDAADKEPGPRCWRGVARVVGREGSTTVWISHRGILLAVCPEHLAKANEQEVNQWLAVGDETVLMDTIPASGGTGFIDLRRAPQPPTPNSEEEPGPPNEETNRNEHEVTAEHQAGSSGQSSSNVSRERAESERDARRAVRSSEFFVAQEAKRRRRQQQQGDGAGSQRPVEVDAQQVPVDPNGTDDPDLNEPEVEYNPDVDDYHQAVPRRQLSPIVEDPAAEAQEREAKRLRVAEGQHSANYVTESCNAYLATEQPGYLKDKAAEHYEKHAGAYHVIGVSKGDLLFGFKRSCFEDRYEALAGAQEEGAATKKKGRKEIKLVELTSEQKEMFTAKGGSDEKEWNAWKTKEACEVLGPTESEKVRRGKPDLIIPTRWVRTNKNDGIYGAPFLAKSRLVVQGFKDKALGFYRRDAPTASATAESICLAVCTYKRFLLFAKDIKNAYFSGKNVGREIYLEQPRGGLPGLQPRQLLKAKKAIYGFAEAARLFWLALRDHLLSDGWEESKLEPALFYLRRQGTLMGILVTHVDDIEGGVHPKLLEAAFEKSSRALEFATNHVKDFIFRGREVKQTSEGHIDVSMRNYALSMKCLQVAPARRKELESELEPEELEKLQSAAGELGWLTRQLRCDLAYENGVIQRCKTDAVVADLVRLKQYIGQARRGADFRQRYWSDVNLETAVVIHLADSGHANGTPDHNEVLRYRSVGGHFILVANAEILKGKEARANIIGYHSSQTKRVCRSTLAAEASHLAEAVEAGDWAIVLLEEALTGQLDLKNWDKLIEKRPRAYVTDARSVFDYLAKDSTSTSSDKRMAIEGALLRETVRKDNAHVRWIDGQQNIANVLTKANAEKDTLKEFLRTGLMSLVQTEANQRLKERKREERQRRKAKKEVQDSKTDEKHARREAAVKEALEFEDDNER